MESQLQPLNGSSLLEAYRSCRRGKRWFLLDYDGTLTSYRTLPELARPSWRLLRVLEKLASHPQNIVFVVSGRDKNTVSS
jgi:trehalose 6-phosphate synthase/phosphatase